MSTIVVDEGPFREHYSLLGGLSIFLSQIHSSSFFFLLHFLLLVPELATRGTSDMYMSITYGMA